MSVFCLQVAQIFQDSDSYRTALVSFKQEFDVARERSHFSPGFAIRNYCCAGNSKQGIGTSGGSIGGFGFLSRNGAHTHRSLSPMKKPGEVSFCFVPGLSPTGNKNTFRRDRWETIARRDLHCRAKFTAISRLSGNKIGTRNDTRSQRCIVRCVRRIAWKKCVLAIHCKHSGYGILRKISL